MFCFNSYRTNTRDLASWRAILKNNIPGCFLCHVKLEYAETPVASNLVAIGVTVKSSGGKNHPVDSKDRKNKNVSKKETVVTKKKVTLNEEGEVVS